MISLSADKSTVFAGMARVLRAGERLGISDVVADDDPTTEVRPKRGAWVGCIAGALSFSEYEEGLADIGFTSVEITPTHSVADGMHSAMVRAVKPAWTSLRQTRIASLGAGRDLAVVLCQPLVRLIAEQDLGRFV